jgi:hypothetical protein
VIDWSDTFWRHATPEALSGCWLWHGALSQDGYGKWGMPTRRAHRVAYERVNGPIGSGLLVCHSCDVRTCVNPDHLWLGTPKQNTHDAIRKGRIGTVDFCPPGRRARGERHGSKRHPERICRGERVRQAKVDAEQVRKLRALHSAGASASSLAPLFGLGKSATLSIINRKTWRHV